MKTVIVIPARYASTRLPRKLLLNDTGKTLIQHTYEAASKATRADELIVATDHDEISQTVADFGGRAVMTDPELPSGTDRVAAAIADRTDIDLVVNVQGDEPEISGAAIDLAIEMLAADAGAVMSTLACPIHNEAKLNDPACVKVVFDQTQRAMYFSRSPIPHARDGASAWLGKKPNCFFQHIGLYVYRRDFLTKLAKLPPAQIEEVEKLEQLRVLSAGYAIQVGVVEEAAAGIDTAADYRAFVERRQQA